jgi:hypothetical protein
MDDQLHPGGLGNAANENVRGVDVTARLDWQWLNAAGAV